MAFPPARRHRPVFLLFAMFLAGSLLGAPAAFAGPLPSGTVGGFEDDGNMVKEAGVDGTLDWDTVQSTTVTVPDDTTDTGLRGSSKENEPENFICDTGGDDPPKDNLLRAYVNVRMAGSGTTVNSAYLDLAYVRKSGNGDAHVNFEFNQSSTSYNCGGKGFGPRTEGDLLIAFDFPGGDGPAAVNTLYWDADAGDDGLGNWVDVALPEGSAAGASNPGTITDPIQGGSVGIRKFGEATIDLVALDKVVPGDVLDCPGYGFVNVRSRSSGESYNAALQDRMPQTPVDLSTCGSVEISKTDDAGSALPGAEFGLFDNEHATGDAVYTCTTDDDGHCLFSDVEPGAYWIKEVAAPDGYDPDPDIVAVTVGFREAVDLTGEPFVDPRQVGHLRVHKVVRDPGGAPLTVTDPSALDGATFLVYSDANDNGGYDAGEEAHLWPNPPADGSDIATCTVGGGTGQCDIGPLATGAYRLTETAAPDGLTWAGDVDVAITETAADQPVEVDGVNVAVPPEEEAPPEQPRGDLPETGANVGVLPLVGVCLIGTGVAMVVGVNLRSAGRRLSS